MSNISIYLKDFKLAGIAKTLDQRLTEATASNMSYSDFLELLLDDERFSRNDNKSKKLYASAKLPNQKRFTDFDFTWHL
jgi:DNA replication protein DnaC